MKTIPILPDVQGTESDGTPIPNLTLKHTKFLLDRLVDPAFTESLDGLARGMIIRSKLIGFQGTSLELEDSDWEKLSLACKRGFNAQIAHNLIGFAEAVVNAK